MPLEWYDLPLGRKIPDMRKVVESAGEQLRAVRAKDRTQHALRVIELVQLLAAGHIPHAGCTIVTGGRDLLAVAAKAWYTNGGSCAVTCEDRYLAPGAHIPNMHGRIRLDDRQ